MTTNKQALSVEERKAKVLGKFPDAFCCDLYDENEDVCGHQIYDNGGIGKPLSVKCLMESIAWVDAYNRHCTAPEPSDAEIREQMMQIVLEVQASTGTASRLAGYERIMDLLRTEAAYKRGKGV